jgi:hypothetical protein
VSYGQVLMQPQEQGVSAAADTGDSMNQVTCKLRQPCSCMRNVCTVMKLLPHNRIPLVRLPQSPKST